MPEEKREKRGGSLIVPTKDEGKKPSSAMISPRKNQVTIKSADMKEEVQKEAIDCAIAAFEKHSVEKDIAAYIKKGFDNKYGPTWHCIVGRNFGSYVTHETNHFMYFYLDQKAILLFKSG
ncbi:dynein light chain 1, cytoplasmic isoform X2 [Amborella trichopoda]|nr:dynein light chain 1, cytoplasmic isoform X2 [Amborella trichopoda]|eukprot:XP_020520606.1 dynein light chain 1, cytoplasmic isoform X2 [Amborella trichopoda]